MWQWFFGLALALISMATPKRALFIGAIFFLVTATINVSLLPVHSTTSCPSSTTDFFLFRWRRTALSPIPLSCDNQQQYGGPNSCL